MASDRRTLAVICARKGSKGLPGKNTRELCGRPLVCWTAEFAGQHARYSVATSDDLAMLSMCQSIAGSRKIQRPEHLCGDDTHIADVLIHAAEEAHNLFGEEPKELVLLYANVPIRRPGVVEDALRMLRETGCDAVVSVAPVGKYHPWWMLEAVPNGEGAFREYTCTEAPLSIYRRQDLPPLYVADGQVIVVKTEALLRSKDAKGGLYARFGNDVRILVEERGASIDIDDEYDLLVAEAMMKARQ